MSNRKITTILPIVFLLGFYFFQYLHSVQHTLRPPSAQSAVSQPSSSQQSSLIGARTKSAGCTVNGALQDVACTPGAIIPTATKDQICVMGYSKSVRNVTSQEKSQVYQEYGINHHSAGEYEVDHLISLELGGSNDIANLWPEAAQPAPGFHEKDGLENYLHAQVCSGAITLSQAQQEVSSNWLAVYQSMH